MNWKYNSLKIDIIYEEDGLIVVNKPAGLSTSGRDLSDPDCLQYGLMEKYRRKIWAVHQLDKDTSGVNLFVRRKSLVNEYMLKLRDPHTVKTYVAICHGVLPKKRIKIDEPIGWLGEKRNSRYGVTPKGKHAKTIAHLIDASKEFSLVSVNIFTGRTHQIRVHLAHIGHPIIGEPWYCDPPCELHYHHALHALSIDFANETNRFSAPIPNAFITLSKKLGLDVNKVDQ